MAMMGETRQQLSQCSLGYYGLSVVFYFLFLDYLACLVDFLRMKMGQMGLAWRETEPEVCFNCKAKF
jgi:hypothetical protein